MLPGIDNTLHEKHSRPQIHDQLIGRTSDVLAALGLDPTCLRRHITCPLANHQDRHASFRVDKERNRFYCSCQPRGRSLVDLTIELGLASSFLEAAGFLRRVLVLEGSQGRDLVSLRAHPTPVPLQRKNIEPTYATDTLTQERHLVLSALENHWERCQPFSIHPYTSLKRIPPLGARLDSGMNRIVLPIRDVQGQLQGLQTIDSQGVKRNAAGSKKAGCGMLLGSNDDDQRLLVAEGWATGVTLHMLYKSPVLVTFGCDNLLLAARAFRLGDQRLVICGDHDETGRGQEAAHHAAQQLGGDVAVRIPPQCGDWNDDYCRRLSRLCTSTSSQNLSI